MIFLKKHFYLLLSILLISSCTSSSYLVKTPFDKDPVPPRPDYALEKNWASLPDKKDPADSVPGNQFTNNEANAQVDVFFIHPTTFTYKPKKNYQWNGDVNDEELNHKTDYSTILYQASIFNGSCKIYAPRYRQAHLSAFFTPDKADGQRALDTAYSDVRSAFQYYLDHYNQGRPFIIASHSQGTTHAVRLIREFMSDSSLRKKMVAAYLVGMPINPDSLIKFFPTCNTPDQTNCFCSWNTFEYGYYPKYYNNGLNHAVCTNPISWSSDTAYCASTRNNGAVILSFNSVMPFLFDAQVHDGLLWTNKPRFRGSFLIRTKIYHRGDYNLYYYNVRENVAERVNAYFQRPR